MWLGELRNLRTVVADARVALQMSPAKRFDVIIGDAFHDIVVPAHLVTKEFFALVRSRLSPDGLYLMNVVDNLREPKLALSILKSMRSVMSHVEMWASNEMGERATFVLTAVPRATSMRTFASKNSANIHFFRIPAEYLKDLSGRLGPIILSDDHAPVDRLIGVE